MAKEHSAAQILFFKKGYGTTQRKQYTKSSVQEYTKSINFLYFNTYSKSFFLFLVKIKANFPKYFFS